jgi:hypothetical protein
MARNGMGNEGNGSNQHLHSIVARAPTRALPDSTE